MAAASDVDEEFGVYNCSEFYTDFLSPLSQDVRKETLNLIHKMNKTGADSAGAAESYTNMLLKIERELGPQHIVCEFVTKDMSESLRKFGLVDEALELVKGRMERIKHEDLGSLLLLSRVQNLCGDYRKSAEPMKRARILAESTGDPVLLCLTLSKECCNLWHLQNPEEAKDKLNLCLNLLEDCEELKSECSYPFSETSLRMIEMYKTLGYIHGFLGSKSKSPEFYMKALEIVEKDEKAVVHRFKLETQIGYQFSKNCNSTMAKEYSRTAYEKITTLSKNENYMIHHTITVLNAMARVAFCLQMVSKSKFTLNVWQEAYRLGEQYKGQNHPIVGRLASDTAFLADKLRERHIATLYVQRAEATLEYCGNEADLDFIKTNVREISDTWSNLGKVYSNRNMLTESERCFKEGIAVNTRVYGINHPRLCRLYTPLGYLYKRFNNYHEAFTCFRKCKKISEEFEPNNSAFHQKMKMEMQTVRQMDRNSTIQEC